jgi:hypothetical protein
MRKNNNNISRININHFLIIALACLIGVQVFISNKIATSGKSLNQLEQHALVMEDQNRKLLSQNVEHLSLLSLYQKAEEMGFIEAEEVIQFGEFSPDLAYKN